MRLPFVISLAIVLAASPATAAGLPLEDLDILDARLAVFLGGSAGDAGRLATPVDRRLRLTHCAEGALFDPPAMGSVIAYCPSRGWRLRVPLAVAQRTEATEVLIRRGDTVELAYAGPGFNVVTTATATEDGRSGGTVRVKSPTGPSIVNARVKGPGAVVISD